MTDILNTFEDIDSDRNRTACQIWLYIDCLIKFALTVSKTVVTKKYKACHYSDLVSDDILQKFTVAGAVGR